MPTEAEVFAYWQAGSCGTVHARSEPGTRGFYDEIETHRYSVEPYIREFADFARWKDKQVLEIGVGAASDFLQFARAGAIVTGVDLTPAAVAHARQRLALEGLRGEVRVASGEALPYPDAAFDLVYSFGVIHHTEHPHRVLREVRRLLAPGGQARIGLYGRQSWAAYKLWVRHALLVGRPRRTISEVIAGHLESPGTRAYTRREIEIMFAAADFERVSIEGFPTPYDRRAAGPLAGLIRLDWMLGVVAS